MVTPFVFQNGNLDLAEYGEDGQRVTNPNMPFFLRFVPRSNLPVTDGNSRFFEQLNDQGTNPIPADATLFDVMALDAPNGTREPWSTP